MEPNLCYLISDSARLLRRTFDERVRSLGLTSVQARLLLALAKFPRHNQSFFAERLEIEPITLTRIVDRMEEAGWVERAADPHDRRARLLALTDKSRDILDPLSALITGLTEDTLMDIGPEQRVELAQVLVRINANLNIERTMPEATHG